MYDRQANIYDRVYAAIGKDYEAESKRAIEIILERKRTDGMALLDVACGTGEHVRHLSKDFEVEGLDLNPAMIEVCNAKCPDVVVHQGDMRSFQLDRKYDAIVCLFSSIGYAGNIEELAQTARNFADHLHPGGVALVEPWLTPDVYNEGLVHGMLVDEPELKIARMNVTQLEGRTSIIDFHFLVADPSGVQHFTERHDLTLFTTEEYIASFESAGFQVDYDETGLMNRGLLIAVKPTAS